MLIPLHLLAAALLFFFILLPGIHNYLEISQKISPATLFMRLDDYDYLKVKNLYDTEFGFHARLSDALLFLSSNSTRTDVWHYA